MKKLLIIIFVPLLVGGFLIGYFLPLLLDNKKQPLNYSEITEKSYYDDFFAGISDCRNNYKPAVKGTIVNHHLLAGKLIAKTICNVATDKKLTIVLLSPNHFSNGQSHVIVSPNAWQTPYGILSQDVKIINDLSAQKIAVIDNAPFKFEHGIYGVIPFIKKAIPNAKIVPIIIKDSTTKEEKENLEKYLIESLPKDSIIIASLDFSHYLTSDQADISDQKSLEILNSFDLEKLKDLNPNSKPDNVDSLPALEIFLSAMKEKGAVNFQMIDNTNSAKLIGDLSIKETTSYIVGLFLQK
ncbi:MAG: AmmeMemoRadiSam system protein B [Candidatus Buchananbacteria bacterium]